MRNVKIGMDDDRAAASPDEIYSSLYAIPSQGRVMPTTLKIMNARYFTSGLSRSFFSTRHININDMAEINALPTISLIGENDSSATLTKKYANPQNEDITIRMIKLSAIIMNPENIVHVEKRGLSLFVKNVPFQFILQAFQITQHPHVSY